MPCALPADVEHLPTAAGEPVVAILVAVLGGTAEVELTAVSLHPESDAGKRQIEDPDQLAVTIVDLVLAHEWR